MSLILEIVKKIIMVESKERELIHAQCSVLGSDIVEYPTFPMACVAVFLPALCASSTPALSSA
jgi:hypothetical protein